jgi:hypothetical protein
MAAVGQAVAMADGGHGVQRPAKPAQGLALLAQDRRSVE